MDVDFIENDDNFDDDPNNLLSIKRKGRAGYYQDEYEDEYDEE